MKTFRCMPPCNDQRHSRIISFATNSQCANEFDEARDDPRSLFSQQNGRKVKTLELLPNISQTECVCLSFFLLKIVIPTHNLDRKALMSPYLKANLAFMRSITHSTPSVFYADQRGMLGFLIRTLGPEIWGHPQPHEEPQHQQGQGLNLENISQKRFCLTQ